MASRYAAKSAARKRQMIAACRRYEIRHPERVLLLKARMRARRQGIAFDLTVDDLSIPPVCPVLGVPLVPQRGKQGPWQYSPTVDRIVPALGYVRGNVVVISHRANRLKSDATPEELAAVVRWYQKMLRRPIPPTH